MKKANNLILGAAVTIICWYGVVCGLNFISQTIRQK